MIAIAANSTLRSVLSARVVNFGCHAASFANCEQATEAIAASRQYGSNTFMPFKALSNALTTFFLAASFFYPSSCSRCLSRVQI